MEVKSEYVDRHFKGNAEEYSDRLKTTKTLYVGNLSFYTTEGQIYEVFSKCGDIKSIIMGIDRNTRTSCGFCFVIYHEREAAEDCIRYINGTKLDERVIRVDWDAGFVEGRQYGRGYHGGQVREEFRTDFDPGRGGFGHMHMEMRDAMRKRLRPRIHRIC